MFAAIGSHAGSSIASDAAFAAMEGAEQVRSSHGEINPTDPGSSSARRAQPQQQRQRQSPTRGITDDRDALCLMSGGRRARNAAYASSAAAG